jgi:hypothetical protein
MTRAHWIALALAAALIGLHAVALVAVARAVCPQHHQEQKP